MGATAGRLPRRRCRPPLDQGLTLIEMVVALLIVSVVFLALNGLLIAGLRSSSLAAERSRAADVLTTALESATATPWSSLTVGTTTSSSTLAGVVYTVSETVSQNGAASYYDKLIAITVSWHDHGGTRTLTASEQRAPTTSDEATPVTTSSVSPSLTVTSASLNPSSETLSSAGNLTSAVTISITTSVAATAVSVVVPTANGNQTVSLTPDSTFTQWTATLAAGSSGYVYNSGAQTLSYTASASGAASATGSLTLTLTAASGATVTVTPSTSSSSQYLDSNGYLVNALTVSATTSSAVSSVSVSYLTASGTTATQSLTSSGSGGTVWSYTFPAGAGGGTWNAGSETFTLTATPASGTAATATTSVTLTTEPATVTITGPSVVSQDSTSYAGFCVTEDGGSANYKLASAALISFSATNPSSVKRWSLTYNGVQVTPTFSTSTGAGSYTVSAGSALAAPGTVQVLVNLTLSDGTPVSQSASIPVAAASC